ncbi:hypothetical protein SIL91_004998 [Salmonella enterica]|nr:hypothetical protein [Salmonella enterica]ELW8656383.1 hypothetical protein [Salmonella enterica]
MKLIYSLSFLSFLSFAASAFNVDSMTKVSESEQEDYFLVSGGGHGREYVYVTLSELISDGNNKSHEVVFDASNVTVWPVVAEPSEIIVSSGEQVKVKIAKNYVSSGVDRIFGITFTPDVLDENQGKVYNISLGYKSWFIVPGSDPLAGDVSARKGERKGDYVISNNTNKVMNVKFTYCNSPGGKDCVVQMTTRPYSDKKVSLGDKVTSTEIGFYTISGDKNTPVKKIKL